MNHTKLILIQFNLKPNMYQRVTKLTCQKRPSLITLLPSQNHHHDHLTITTISSTTISQNHYHDHLPITIISSTIIILILSLPLLKNILHVKYFLSLKYFMQNKLTLKNRDKDINKGLRIQGRLKHSSFFFR